MADSTTLQIATLVAASLSPFVAFRHSRRLAIAANRQAWLDAFRDDVARFISLSDGVSTSMEELEAVKKNTDAVYSVFNIVRNRVIEFQQVRFRIRLRLKSGNKHHEHLICVLMKTEATNGQPHERKKWRDDFVDAAEAIIQETWREIESGKLYLFRFN